MKVELTKDNFQQEVFSSDLPVLVDFWAEWCGPCKMVEPIINELAVELAGQLKVASVDIDNNSDLAAQFSIMSIPTMVLFKNGELVDKIVGVVPKNKILEKISEHVEL